MKIKSYWLSWTHKDKYGEFEIHSPWWCSGYDSNDNSMICAAVKAKNEQEAEDFIYKSYDKKPEDIKFRFIELLDRSLFTDRFPKADWMKWDDEK